MSPTSISFQSAKSCCLLYLRYVFDDDEGNHTVNVLYNTYSYLCITLRDGERKQRKSFPFKFKSKNAGCHDERVHRGELWNCANRINIGWRVVCARSHRRACHLRTDRIGGRVICAVMTAGRTGTKVATFVPEWHKSRAIVNIIYTPCYFNVF